MFADRAKIIIRSGKGGDGHISFRRDLYVPNASIAINTNLKHRTVRKAGKNAAMELMVMTLF